MAKLVPGINDLATINPELAKEVSPESKIKATEITSGSGNKLLWRCSKGHEWEATVNDRSRGRGCPYCSNKKLLLGFNDLATTNPRLAKEVSPHSKIKATEVTEGSKKKLLWMCGKGHEWEAIVLDRSHGNGCPYCSNRKILPGFNDLATTNPELAKEVSPASKIKATEITVGSSRKLLWRCEWGHEWEAEVKSRFQGVGCPYCSNKKVLPGFNDLMTVNPVLAKEVSPDSKIKATEVTVFSNKKLLWRCSKGHEWGAIVNNRSGGRGCPYCSNQKILPGFNDLATTNPELTEEISPRSKIKATQITAGSHKKILWMCNNGHEWKSIVKDRSKGHGCPKCFGSKMEESLAELIKTLLPENVTILRNNRQLIKPYELDILIPDINLAFEFNCDYWHNDENIHKRHTQFKSSKQFDDFKKRECEKQGVELHFIREKQWVNNYEKTVSRLKKIVARKLRVSSL